MKNRLEPLCLKTTARCASRGLMATLGAYCLLASPIEQEVSPENVLFVQSKQAVSPKSGHEAYLGAFVPDNLSTLA